MESHYTSVAMNKKNDITRSLPTEETLRFRSFRLHGLTGRHTGNVVDIQQDVFRVGSQAPCELVVQDPAVSRLHCEIRREKDGFYLVDRESKNGTYVNNVRIERARLESGEIIRIGESEFRFEPQTEEVSLVPSSAENFGEIYGKSYAIRKIYTLAERVAASNLTVLIAGETGSGRKSLARSIHAASKRAGAPLVHLSVSSLTPTQLEARLLATHGRTPNVFLQAEGGTLILEAIDELPLDLQGKLLQILDKREIWDAKTDRMMPLDFRLIALTTQDLKSLVKAKRFRDELFFRLNVVTIQMPSLRDRREDIAPLSERFVKSQGPSRSISSDAMDLLKAYDWSGNVQELFNVLDRALAMASGSKLESKDFMLERPAASSKKSARAAGEDGVSLSGKTMEEIEKMAIEQALKELRWNRTAVAKRLGIAYSTLYEKLRKYGLMGKDS